MRAGTDESVSAAELPVARWCPRPALVVPETVVDRPRFPVVDIHNHIGRWLSPSSQWLGGTVSELVGGLDEAGVQTLVNLDGRWDDDLAMNLERYDLAHPGRFVTFCHLDWSALTDSGSPDDAEAGETLAAQLHVAASQGARGVKVWKDLGLSVRDGSGRLVMPDDARVVAALRVAGELGLPVLIHTADPVAFFDPLDEHNERLDELGTMPEWWFGGPEHPTFDELIAALERLVASCPDTTFVGAHVGCYSENLQAVGDMLARRPNWNVDTGGRLGEIGRQPRAFRRLVESFPDRVVFGSDCYPPDLDEYRRWWRFLETDDEHFAYHADADESGQPTIPPQGRWRISGVRLPDDLLSRVYRDNAVRILDLRPGPYQSGDSLASRIIPKWSQSGVPDHPKVEPVWGPRSTQSGASLGALWTGS
ncbi:MAG TPA: amidohydrolase family protein [Nocardioidaceae bacterium]|nr:amidohydrolase family protein [Nocardioidaceae bacterium]